MEAAAALIARGFINDAVAIRACVPVVGAASAMATLVTASNSGAAADVGTSMSAAIFASDTHLKNVANSKLTHGSSKQWPSQSATAEATATAGMGGGSSSSQRQQSRNGSQDRQVWQGAHRARAQC